MDIYMSQPRGFEAEGREDWYCKLDKALYGIPPAGQCWYDDCSKFLRELGFKQSRADPCLFRKQTDNGHMVISLTVDDFLEFSTSTELQKNTVEALFKKFEYIDNGPATWFLGMGVTQNYDKIQLCQKDFINTIVDEHPGVRTHNTPGVQGTVLAPDTERAKFPYRSLCGKLRYVTITRPEIEFALNQCCRYQESPGTSHVTALLRIVGYLKKFPNMPLTYNKSATGITGPLEIVGTADASHADNLKDRRSSFGYITTLNNGPVAWKSRLTPMVATSVAEAEYVALSEVLKELLHLRMVVTELGYAVAGPITITRTRRRQKQSPNMQGSRDDPSILTSATTSSVKG
jgi:hypothetical protein